MWSWTDLPVIVSIMYANLLPPLYLQPAATISKSYYNTVNRWHYKPPVTIFRNLALIIFCWHCISRHYHFLNEKLLTELPLVRRHLVQNATYIIKRFRYWTGKANKKTDQLNTGAYFLQLPKWAWSTRHWHCILLHEVILFEHFSSWYNTTFQYICTLTQPVFVYPAHYFRNYSQLNYSSWGQSQK